MGVKHLKELREHLEQNANKAFSRSELRDELKQNYPTILANLDYLMHQEMLVEQIGENPIKFKWKRGKDTNGKLSTKDGKETQSHS